MLCGLLGAVAETMLSAGELRPARAAADRAPGRPSEELQNP
jgi:hypothetical protein